MKIKIKNIAIILVLIATSACTKIINVDLNSANQKIVVDAYVQNLDSNKTTAKVKLTKTGSFYSNNNTFETVNQATLFIKDNNGQTYNFTSQGNGIFVCDSMPASIPNAKYELSGSIEGNAVDAITTIPQKVPIDSIKISYFPYAPMAQSWLFPTCCFKDIPGQENYYRFNFYINGVLNTESIEIFSDKGIDGKNIEYKIYSAVLLPGDLIRIDLFSIDKFSFDYYKILNQNVGGSSNNANPGNPISNVKDDFLGLFCGQAVSSKTIIVQ